MHPMVAAKRPPALLIFFPLVPTRHGTRSQAGWWLACDLEIELVIRFSGLFVLDCEFRIFRILLRIIIVVSELVWPDGTVIVIGE